MIGTIGLGDQETRDADLSTTSVDTCATAFVLNLKYGNNDPSQATTISEAVNYNTTQIFSFACLVTARNYK